MADVLTIGGFVFDDFSTPAGMPAGGKQAMIVHKLPGGSRVINTLGPDENDISWSGQFFGDDAYTKALALDAMRAAGQVQPLIFAGQFRSVLISNFTYQIRRLPVWVEYSITLVVYQNPSLGALGVIASSVDTLILSDLAAGLGL